MMPTASSIAWADVGQEGRAFVFHVCDRVDRLLRGTVAEHGNCKLRDRTAAQCVAWAGARNLLCGDDRFWSTARPWTRTAVMELLMGLARLMWAHAHEVPESDRAPRLAGQATALVAAVEVLNAA